MSDEKARADASWSSWEGKEQGDVTAHSAEAAAWQAQPWAGEEQGDVTAHSAEAAAWQVQPWEDKDS